VGLDQRWSCFFILACDWFFNFLEITNAFLLVPPQERVLVREPSWWTSYDNELDSGYWSLDWCLPGQKSAASRFFDFMVGHLTEGCFENTPLLPSLSGIEPVVWFCARMWVTP